MAEWYDPETGALHNDDPVFADWTQEQVDLLLSQDSGYLGVADNRYGVPTAVFRCTACGRAFTLTPVPPRSDLETVCGIPGLCPGYDPNRDVFRLLQNGATLHKEEA